MWWRRGIFGSSRFQWGYPFQFTLSVWIAAAIMDYFAFKTVRPAIYLLTPLVGFGLSLSGAAIELLVRSHKQRG